MCVVWLRSSAGGNRGDQPGQIPQGAARLGGERGESRFGGERHGETARKRSHQFVAHEDGRRSQRLRHNQRGQPSQ